MEADRLSEPGLTLAAGSDLGFLKLEKISIDGDRVEIHLQGYQLRAASLDTKDTHASSRATGLLATAIQTLNSVRKAAEQQIE